MKKKMYLTLWLTIITRALNQLCCAEHSPHFANYGPSKKIPGAKDICDQNVNSHKISGYYYVYQYNSVNGIKQVYCDMELECGGYIARRLDEDCST